MKINIFLSFLFVSFIAQAQIVDIPDANFKYMLVNHSVADFDGDGNTDGSVDTNNDDEIQVSEAEAVLGLNFFPIEIINSMQGIEAFSNLEWLTVQGHDINILDVSQNNNLEKLNCNSNNISSLLLPESSSLLELSCYHNQITSLDVSLNINLKILSCSNNSLTNINLSQNTSLETILCNYNFIEEIDFTQNLDLIYISVAENQLISLDVTQNLNLQNLSFGYNSISDIDLTQNSELLTLECVYNNLTEIDLSQNFYLEEINLAYNNFTDIDISSYSNIKRFNCNGNPLTSLNIQNGNNINMTQMWAFNNPNLQCIQVDDENYSDFEPCDYPWIGGWCIDSGVIFSEDCENLGIDNITSTSFDIYPNPAKDILFIESQELIDSVNIYNLQGQLIIETVSSRVDVSQLTTGLYFVQVIVNGKSETKKFIKN